MQVWLAMTKHKDAVEPVIRVVTTLPKAHEVVERFAQTQNLPIAADGNVECCCGNVDSAAHPDTGRLFWFAPLDGVGPEARIEGPIEIEG